MSILFTVISFIVAISLLVAVHEFGHYWVAKKMGIKILRFSIGFGKPIWKKTFGQDQTEFVIASLPFGGYVKMLDKREGFVKEEDMAREFTTQPVWSRIAVVVAGPAFNFIFAIAAYLVMLIIGVTGVKPIIGNVVENGMAENAGFKTGYEIVSINNKQTPIWDVAIQNIIPVMIDRGQAKIEFKNQQGQLQQHTLDFTTTEGEIKVEKLFDELGFRPWRPVVKPVVGKILENSPAASAGFKIDDNIIEVNGQATPDWMDVIKLVSSQAEKIVNVTVLRDDQKLTLQVIPEAVNRDGKKIGRIGIAQKNGATYPDEMKVMYHYSFIEAIGKSLSKTWDNSVLTLKMIGKILVGDVSVKNLSGPVSIAVYAGHSANAGVARFLDFLAIVSISLGVLNLLPIPILDGGHLVYYIVEIFRGKPVSDEFQELGARFGIALLLLLMMTALYNDILRLFQ